MTLNKGEKERHPGYQQDTACSAELRSYIRVAIDTRHGRARYHYDYGFQKEYGGAFTLAPWEPYRRINLPWTARYERTAAVVVPT